MNSLSYLTRGLEHFRKYPQDLEFEGISREDFKALAVLTIHGFPKYAIFSEEELEKLTLQNCEDVLHEYELYLQNQGEDVPRNIKGLVEELEKSEEQYRRENKPGESRLKFRTELDRQRQFLKEHDAYITKVVQKVREENTKLTQSEAKETAVQLEKIADVVAVPLILANSGQKQNVINSIQENPVVLEEELLNQFPNHEEKVKKVVANYVEKIKTITPNEPIPLLSQDKIAGFIADESVTDIPIESLLVEVSVFKVANVTTERLSQTQIAEYTGAFQEALKKSYMPADILVIPHVERENREVIQEVVVNLTNQEVAEKLLTYSKREEEKEKTEAGVLGPEVIPATGYFAIPAGIPALKILTAIAAKEVSKRDPSFAASMALYYQLGVYSI